MYIIGILNIEIQLSLKSCMDLLVGEQHHKRSRILTNCVGLIGFACKILWLLERKNH